MAPLTAEELQKHPEYEHTIWKLKPDQEGKVAVAKDRGGPVNIAYEVHGHGDRKIVVSVQLPTLLHLWHRVSGFYFLPDLRIRCGKRLPVTFRFGRIDRLSLQPHVSACQVYHCSTPLWSSSAHFRTRRTYRILQLHPKLLS